jgi:5-methylcytosine-specific restriction endonuclease McrA
MLGGKCTKCGFTGNPAALQFHHVNPQDKKYTLYSKNLLRKDRVEEAKKCIILCANCHIDQHTNKELLKKFGVLP